jgi:aminomuconate-semialdehyde/2-hydroxymuconate-6-semialdehyde dehydrogenase
MDPDAPARAGEFHNYVNGAFVPSAATFPDISPVDGSVVGMVHEADADLVDAAVRAARAALDGAWGRALVQQRAALLRRVADRIEDRAEEFLAAEVGDTGKPLELARSLDVARASANFRQFADLISATGQESYLTEFADGRRALNYAYRKPLGVVGVIVPWNLPLLLLTWKVAPALACGNAVVVKPSEETPASATLLADVMRETTAELGVPAGVFNLVHGFGPNSAGEYLTRHPGVDGITFTGESVTGSRIMRAVAADVKPISFELGGKNAAIVFADADFDAAVAGVARSSFTNTGQVCLCTERVYVERPIFADFVAALAERAARYVPGGPADAADSLGPLISRAHRDKVLGYYELAVKEGATVVTGGEIPVFGDARDDGAYVQPTVWTGLPDSARCVTEEVFGPVCHVAPFENEEDVIRRANATRYGLASVTWTSDLLRAHRVAQRMNVGLSWVNTWFLRDLRTPFGGMGLSGIGREGGTSSLHFYSEPTNICIDLGAA